MFRDMENKVMEKATDPMKESGNGKEAPIKQVQKWWDIRNWPHEVLERMTNSPWQENLKVTTVAERHQQTYCGNQTF